jgi:hypothetical protein
VQWSEEGESLPTKAPKVRCGGFLAACNRIRTRIDVVGVQVQVRVNATVDAACSEVLASERGSSQQPATYLLRAHKLLITAGTMYHGIIDWSVGFVS